MLKSTEGDRLRKFGGNEKRYSHTRKSYVKYFDGYVEYKVPKKNGKGLKTERTYIADYYKRDLPEKTQRKIKLLYIALFMVMIGVFIFSAIQRVPSNSVWYVALSQALCIMGMAAVVYSLVEYLAAPELMTRYSHWRSNCVLIRFTRLSAFFFGLLSVMTLLSLLLHLGFYLWRETVNILCYLACAAASYAIYWIESNKIVYISVKNNYINVPVQDGFVIDENVD